VSSCRPLEPVSATTLLIRTISTFFARTCGLSAQLLKAYCLAGLRRLHLLCTVSASETRTLPATLVTYGLLHNFHHSGYRVVVVVVVVVIVIVESSVLREGKGRIP
jgi:hypothetical protein